MNKNQKQIEFFDPDKYKCWLTGYGSGNMGIVKNPRQVDQVKAYKERNDKGVSKRAKHKR